jgi:hypothetical protein
MIFIAKGVTLFLPQGSEKEFSLLLLPTHKAIALFSCLSAPNHVTHWTVGRIFAPFCA